MDFDSQNNLHQPSPQQPPGVLGPKVPVVPQSTGPVKKVSPWKIFWAVITVLSVLANVVLLFMLFAVIMVFAAGPRDVLTEEVIQAGPRHTKIAVIRLQGIIDSRQARDFRKQIQTAQRDSSVRALIIRTISPGGTVSASDRIHNEIRKFRRETNKPVVAFMQGLAASGGYYTSVASDKIIAEPTTITGSIGVMMGHFVLQELLEEKLGIKPVVIKSGERKDWPSMFEPVTEEQQQYFREKLIKPAYERFVSLVAQGRQPLLSPEKVRELADGSIYHAAEALDKKLIDKIGYIDDAIELAKSLAGIEKAHVIEYRRPFSFSAWLTSQTAGLLKIDRETLQELAVPQLLYLWQF